MELSKMIEMSNAYNISTEEFIVLYMIFLSQIDENDGLGRKELLQLYIQNDNNAETLEKTIQSLKDKNIIKKDFNYVKGKTNPSNIPLRQNIINQLFKHSGELGEELCPNLSSNAPIAGAMRKPKPASSQERKSTAPAATPTMSARTSFPAAPALTAATM